jgi:hypothetical protein
MERVRRSAQPFSLESSFVRLTPGGDLLIRQRRQLGAASVHLNGNIAQCRAAKAQPGNLMMIRASNVVKFLQRPLLEFLNGLA